MPHQMAGYIVKQLEKEFSRRFPAAGLEMIGPAMIKEPKAAMEAAYDFFVLNGRFPSPQQLLDKVQEEAKKLRTAEAAEREKEWQKQKGDRRDGSFLSQEYSDEYAKLSMKALRFMLSSAADDQKLECMRAMAIQFPHTEWGKKGAELQKEWGAENRNGASVGEDGAGVAESS